MKEVIQRTPILTLRGIGTDGPDGSIPHLLARSRTTAKFSFDEDVESERSR